MLLFGFGIVFFEPRYSFNRIFLTKISVAISVLDDTYDAYGRIYLGKPSTKRGVIAT